MTAEKPLQVNSIPFSPLSLRWNLALFFISAFIVGFGQPAWSSLLSIVAALSGYILFFRILLTVGSMKQRFWLGTAWFTIVQMIQLQWTLAHPFLYIYGVWIFFSFLLGTQFGVLSLFITPKQFSKFKRILALAGLWTLIEWSRLFFLSGYTWNPIGLALSANLNTLQTASIWGVYGLTFWVMLVNLLGIRAWMYRFQWQKSLAWGAFALFPFVFGAAHLALHRPELEKHRAQTEDPFHIVLVQTVFPVEEALGFWATKNMTLFVMDEWKQILNITVQHYGKDNDMIVLPEFVVPFGTWTPVYPYEKVREAFEATFGSEAIEHLPPLASPFAQWGKVGNGIPGWYVNNAFWLQGMANIFDANVVAGLEDVDANDQDRVLYSAAMHFQPQKATDEMIAQGYLDFPVNRYEKRVLVPMGEYIPFTFLNNLANEYGIFGSFTNGKEAKIFTHHKIPFSVSICYEETFGDLTRECRLLGAEMIVNVTSDAWFPNSILPQQHFDHARLRSVESGVPLVRACNTGVTCGVDSLGQVVAVLGETQHEREWTADSIRFEVPTYTYHTIYSKVGDALIVGLSGLFMLIGFRFKNL